MTAETLDRARGLQQAINATGAGSRNLPAVSNAVTVDPVFLERITALRQTLAPNLTEGELELFALVAQRKGLDPFSGQILAVKRSSRNGPRVTYQTGIDGYRSLAERTGEYRGSDEPEFGPACECGKQPTYHPEWARVIVHRRLGPDDYIHQPARAKWHEFVPQEAFMWGEKPEVMLGKCAEAQALRKAFPWVLGDLYIPEEMAHEDAPAATAPVVTARAAVAARAAELRGTTDDAPGPQDDDDAPPAPVPASPEPEAPGPTEAVADPMTAEEFGRKVRAAGIPIEVAKATSGDLYPGRPASSLTNVEWGNLWQAIDTAATSG